VTVPDTVCHATARAQEDSEQEERVTQSRGNAADGQAHHASPGFGPGVTADAAEFAERVRRNQQHLRANLKARYDVIVCGSGSSGSVVARRLAENPSVSVLLLEAGGDDDVPSIMDPSLWPANLGSERDWSFHAQPNPHLNGRSIPLAMGRVLGGGSSINVLAWSRGHQRDWDFFAEEAGDADWSYASVLQRYRRLEDWHGAPDPSYRGTGGRCVSNPPPIPTPSRPHCWKPRAQ
jgi:choline dehydrogenase